MVNQGIVNYLRRFSGRYTMNQLKSGLVSQGYNSKDIDEAIAFLQGKPVGKQATPTGESNLMEVLKWGSFAGLASGGIKFVMEFLSNLFNITSTTFFGYFLTLFVAVISGIAAAVIVGQFGDKLPFGEDLFQQFFIAAISVDLLLMLLFNFLIITELLLLGMTLIGIVGGSYVYAKIVSKRLHFAF